MRFARLIWLVFLLSTAILLLIFAVALVRSQEPNIRGFEANVIYTLQLLFDGKALYLNPEVPPFNVVQYTPIYYALVKSIGNIGQIQSENFFVIALLGRSLSLSFSIILAFLISFQVWRFGLPKEGGLSVFVIVIALSIPWYLVVRPDSLMSLFTFTAIFLFIHYLKNRKHPIPIMLSIGVLFALALFTKQTALVFLVMVLFFPFYRFQDRAWILLGILLGTGFILLSLRDYFSLWPTPENFFYQNVIDGLKNGIDILLANQKIFSVYFSQYHSFFLLPAIVSILSCTKLLKLQGKDLTWQERYKAISVFDNVFLFLIYAFWFSTLAGLVMALKDGSAINYLIEAMFFSLILLAYFLSQETIRKKWLMRLELRISLVLYVAVIIFGLSLNLALNFGEYTVRSTPREVWHESFEILEAEFALHPDDYFIHYSRDIFDRWLTLYFYKQSALTPRDIYELSNFDLSAVETMLENGQIRWFISYRTDFPERVFGFDNLHDYFELWQETETHYIYINRNSN